MPLFFEQSGEDKSRIAVWDIAESTEDLIKMAMLDTEESLVLDTYSNEKRKKQWLACRVLIKEIFRNKHHIDYNEYGKPFLKKPHKHISFSHSGNFSALIVNEYSSVGIDIEMVSKRLERVSERFLSDEELSFIDTNKKLSHLTICWSVKEAIFKIHGNLCYDFKKQIRIQPFCYSEKGVVLADVFDENDSFLKSFFVTFNKVNDYFLAFTTEQ